MKLQKIQILAVSVLFLSGCAFGTRHPQLTYKPVSKSDGPRNVSIFVEHFKDERTEKNVIGHVRNGWGLKTADVVTDTNISEWVAEALKSELGNAGYVVVKDRKEITAGGEVLSVYCDSFMMYEGKVEIELVLKKNNEVIIEKKYSGKATNLNWAATAKSYGLTLEQSLQSVMKQVITDINQKFSVDVSSMTTAVAEAPAASGALTAPSTAMVATSAN